MDVIKIQSLVLASSILGTTDLKSIIAFSEMIYGFLSKDMKNPEPIDLKSEDEYLINFLSCIKVQKPTGTVNLSINQDMLDHLNLMMNNPRTILISYRQSGKTTNILLFALLEALKGKTVLISTAHRRHSEYMIAMLNDMIKDAITTFVFPKIVRNDNSRIIFDNYGTIIAAPINENLGRGMSINTILIDEACYINHARLEAFLNAIGPCMLRDSMIHMVSSKSKYPGPVDSLMLNSDWETFILPYSKSVNHNKKVEEQLRLQLGDQYDTDFECN